MSDKYQVMKEERYQRFVFTLNQCGMFLVNDANERIETCIFENFDIGVRGDISDENLELFMDEGWIDEEIKVKCLELKRKFLNIQTQKSLIWNIQSVRESNVWKEILELSDEIKNVAELRLKHPEASLEKIGEMLEPKLSKAGVSHRFKKIKMLADELREEIQ